MSGNNDISVCKGQQYVVTTYTAGSTTNNFLVLRPQLIDRLVTLSDAYNLYRFTRLKIEKIPCSELNSSALMPSNIVQGTAVVFDVVDLYPNTVSVLSEFPYSMCFSPGSMTVSKTLNIPRSACLRTAETWFKTKNGLATDWEEQQGLILFQDESVSGTSTAAIVVHYEIEFCDPCPIIDTPEALEAKASAMRRKRVQVDLSPHVMSECPDQSSSQATALAPSLTLTKHKK